MVVGLCFPAAHSFTQQHSDPGACYKQRRLSFLTKKSPVCMGGSNFERVTVLCSRGDLGKNCKEPVTGKTSCNGPLSNCDSMKTSICGQIQTHIQVHTHSTHSAFNSFSIQHIQHSTHSAFNTFRSNHSRSRVHSTGWV